MGNGLHVSLSNYSGIVQFPSYIPLRRSAGINMSTDRGESWDDWAVSYNLHGSTCILNLLRKYDECGKVIGVVFFFRHNKYLNVSFHLRRTQTGFIKIGYDQHHDNSWEDMKWMKVNRNVGARGGFTDTKVHLYGDANEAGLLVSECKINGFNDKENSEVTVAHYFANGSGSSFIRTESDIGLSFVSRCRVSNDNLDVTVEGLEQHPAFVLFYMFHEVDRSGVWKRTMCPHCYDKRRGRMFWQSDSDDSDGNLLVPWLPGSEHKRKSISNEGRFNGNGNGNFIRCQNYYGS